MNKDREQLCREFCLLNGIEWHDVTIEDNKLSKCSCGMTGIMARTECWKNNPIFPDAKSILEVMMGREDWNSFSMTIGSNEYYAKNPCLMEKVHVLGCLLVDLKYIMDSDKLLQAAVEWCRENKAP